jgi:hypothetical protein
MVAFLIMTRAVLSTVALQQWTEASSKPYFLTEEIMRFEIF